MRRVTYAGASFVTTDEVADALFGFIAALDRGSTGEAIEVPAVSDEGKVHGVRLLVWPGSELMSVHQDIVWDESQVDAIVSELQNRTARLHVMRGATFGAPSSWSLIDPDDNFPS